MLPGSRSTDRLPLASRSPFRAYRRLYLSQAAIDEQLDASYVAAVVGGQEQDGLRDFIRGAGTAQGNIANRALYKLIDLFLRHPERGVVAWRRDDARTDCIHPNLASLEVDGPGARKRADRGLGRAVDAEGRTAGGGNDRRVQYDRSARLEQRERLLHGKQQSPHVHVKLFVKMFFTDLPERSKRTGAGIGKDDVGLALLLLYRCIQLVEVGHF